MKASFYRLQQTFRRPKVRQLPSCSSIVAIAAGTGIRRLPYGLLAGHLPCDRDTTGTSEAGSSSNEYRRRRCRVRRRLDASRRARTLIGWPIVDPPAGLNAAHCCGDKTTRCNELLNLTGSQIDYRFSRQRRRHGHKSSSKK